MTGTYLYSRDQFENYQADTLEHQFRSNARRTKTHDFILGYDQQIFQTGERNLNLQVRGNYHCRSLPRTPQSPRCGTVLLDHFGDPASAGWACVADEDTFEEDFLNYRIGDVEFFFEDSRPTRRSTSRRRTVNPDPVFGQRNLRITELHVALRR